MQLLFWPFMILSVLVAVFAIVSKKTKLLILSAILILPLSLYLAATPRFEIWGLIFPLFYVGAAVALAKKMIWLSILLILPNIWLIGWLGVIVLRQ